MPHYIEFLAPQIGVECIYSFIIIICSLMIYFATKEMYELSSYKGIKYFRQAFLFFALAYFFRYFIRSILILFNIKEVFELSPMLIGFISIFIFFYSSSMAVFYLSYSIMWKKWNNKIKIYLFNILSILIALIGTSIRGWFVPVILNIVLLFFVLFILFSAYKDSKKGKNLFIIYIILFIFWILNIIDLLMPRFLQLYQLIIYLFSILLFMIILYKVLKKAGN